MHTSIIDVPSDLCTNIKCIGQGVAIGADELPTGYALAVKGRIIMEGGKILSSTRWPDYVFASDYELMPLTDLKKFIVTNGHLPNIPNAKDVKKNGVDLTEMSQKLLEKTEELTLYLLQLDERLQKIEEQTEK